VKGDRPKDEVAKEIQTVVEQMLFHA
jgi:hypothetical protein